VKEYKVDKRVQLLISAKHLFATKGFDKTSIRDIANHAGVNSSMISYYFGGKNGLIQAIFDEFFPKKVNMPKITDPISQLEQLMRIVIELRKRDTELVDFLHREILSKENMRMIRPFIEPLWKDVKDLLIAGKNQGVFEYDSIEVAFNYIQASMSYPYHLNILANDEATVELDTKFIDEIIQLVMKGVTRK